MDHPAALSGSVCLSSVTGLLTPPHTLPLDKLWFHLVGTLTLGNRCFQSTMVQNSVVVSGKVTPTSWVPGIPLGEPAPPVACAVPVTPALQHACCFQVAGTAHLCVPKSWAGQQSVVCMPDCPGTDQCLAGGQARCHSSQQGPHGCGRGCVVSASCGASIPGSMAAWFVGEGRGSGIHRTCRVIPCTKHSQGLSSGCPVPAWRGPSTAVLLGLLVPSLLALFLPRLSILPLCSC
jgi:hypothetical protein